jgi:acyl-CoA hydrolase
MTVAVEMIREHPISGQRRSVVRGSFEMVAVDDAGRPTATAEMADPPQPAFQLT